MSRFLKTLTTASALALFATAANAQTGDSHLPRIYGSTAVTASTGVVTQAGFETVEQEAQAIRVYQSKTYGQPAADIYHAPAATSPVTSTVTTYSATPAATQAYEFPLAKTYSSREAALQNIQVEIFDTPIPAYGTTTVYSAANTTPTYQAPRYTSQPYAAPSYGSQYTIAAGDTLYSIARRHGLKASELMNANSLSSSSISPGQVLTIPSATQTFVQAVPAQSAPVTSASTQVIRNVTPVPVNGNVYAVLPGDTLYSIARRTCSTVSGIALSSGISESGILSPGQRLTLPQGSCAN